MSRQQRRSFVSIALSTTTRLSASTTADPAYFGGYLNQNYLETAAALDLDRDQIIQLARNSIEAAFTTTSERRADLDTLAAYCMKA